MAQPTHGLTHHPLFNVWQSMKNRCYNENAQAWDRYGGRGIDVCNEWKESFKCFYDWSISNGWMKGLHIDRIDNDKGYRPNNVRFVTMKENQRNKRNNRLITYNNVTKPLIYWAEKYGIGKTTLKERLNRGWSVGKSLETPVNKCST